MPRLAGQTVRGEFLTLQKLVIGKPVTPAEINSHVGRGNYAAKYISFLRRRYGFKIESVKYRRVVVAYVLEAEPPQADRIRARAKVP